MSPFKIQTPDSVGLSLEIVYWKSTSKRNFLFFYPSCGNLRGIKEGGLKDLFCSSRVGSRLTLGSSVFVISVLVVAIEV